MEICHLYGCQYNCNCKYKCTVELRLPFEIYCVCFTHCQAFGENTQKLFFPSIPTFATWLKTVSPLMEDESGQSVLTGSKTDFKDLHLRRKGHQGACLCAPKRICQAAGTEQMWIPIQANYLSLQNAQLKPINMIYSPRTDWFTLPISYIMVGSTS